MALRANPRRDARLPLRVEPPRRGARRRVAAAARRAGVQHDARRRRRDARRARVAGAVRRVVAVHLRRRPGQRAAAARHGDGRQHGVSRAEAEGTALHALRPHGLHGQRHVGLRPARRPLRRAGRRGRGRRRAARDDRQRRRSGVSEERAGPRAVGALGGGVRPGHGRDAARAARAPGGAALGRGDARRRSRLPRTYNCARGVPRAGHEQGRRARALPPHPRPRRRRGGDLRPSRRARGQARGAAGRVQAALPGARRRPPLGGRRRGRRVRRRRAELGCGAAEAVGGVVQGQRRVAVPRRAAREPVVGRQVAQEVCAVQDALRVHRRRRQAAPAARARRGRAGVDRVDPRSRGRGEKGRLRGVPRAARAARRARARNARTAWSAARHAEDGPPVFVPGARGGPRRAVVAFWFATTNGGVGHALQLRRVVGVHGAGPDAAPGQRHRAAGHEEVQHRGAEAARARAAVGRDPRAVSARRVRVRRVRRGPLVDVHLRGAGHVRGQEPEGQGPEQLHRGHRRRRDHRRHGLRGDEQRQLPPGAHDHGAQRQRPGVAAHGHALRRRRHPQRRAERLHAAPHLVGPFATFAGRQGHLLALPVGDPGHQREDRRVRPRHRHGRHAVRGARLLLHRPRRRPRLREPRAHPRESAGHAVEQARAAPHQDGEGLRLRPGHAGERQDARRRQVRRRDGQADLPVRFILDRGPRRQRRADAPRVLRPDLPRLHAGPRDHGAGGGGGPAEHDRDGVRDRRQAVLRPLPARHGLRPGEAQRPLRPRADRGARGGRGPARRQGPHHQGRSGGGVRRRRRDGRRRALHEAPRHRPRAQAREGERRADHDRGELRARLRRLRAPLPRPRRRARRRQPQGPPHGPARRLHRDRDAVPAVRGRGPQREAHIIMQKLLLALAASSAAALVAPKALPAAPRSRGQVVDAHGAHRARQGLPHRAVDPQRRLRAPRRGGRQLAVRGRGRRAL
ncbi:hypothetical protein JL720_1030 [Aureococcus anophagefferens]|nr:hypothetical protein JL720_1030 [Aureococcus anophagefferens]